MKCLLLSGLIFCSFIAVAQNWCPSGATWHYNFLFFGSYGYVQYNYDKDTTINQINCKRICGTLYYTGPPDFAQVDTSFLYPIFTYSLRDTVYFLYDTIFQPCFYFNAQVGDTLVVSGHQTVVDSNGILTYNNQNFRYYVFHLLDSCYGDYLAISQKVVERIGIFTNDILPQWICTTDGENYSFRCYGDGSFPLYSVDTAHSCDYIYTGIGEMNATLPINVYPNPANDFCTLRLDDMIGYYTARFIDVTGTEIMTFKITNPITQIPIASLPSGLYLVKVSDEWGHIGVGKLVKE